MYDRFRRVSQGLGMSGLWKAALLPLGPTHQPLVEFSVELARCSTDPIMNRPGFTGEFQFQ